MKKKALIALASVGALSILGLYYQNSVAPELGVTHGKLKPLGTRPNDISSQTNIPGKHVEPLPFKATAEETMAALKQAVHEYGGDSLKEEGPDYLYVVFTTPVLRFHDDVEFWLDRRNRMVHVRSASRAGYSDRGLNRERYEKIRATYLSI